MKAKKKAARSTPAPRWLLNEKTAPPVLALGAMVVVILLTLAFHALFDNAAPDNSTNTTSAKNALEITTTDQVTLAATLDYPSGNGPFPVVVLIHSFGQDRSEWEAYRELFIGEGFAVLRYDVRGFGESKLAGIPAAQGAWFASMPNDVEAVVRFASSQTKINDEQIFVIGVGLGANVAYVASGSVSGISKTVVLSPTVNAQLDGSSRDNFFPRRILGFANAADAPALESLLSRVNDAASQSVRLDDPAARGVSILDDATNRDRIIAWLTL